ncbi:hypothetical protein LZD49_26735 [Dyadobacter sp. CY261]|uniref:hypothetical protein n=1 Tax=Dyadobacter sp. CY261 TaxID=2907203 RepID=UPI001F2F8EEA|nr:hypothetical protein [Dyadobacter sp. CY261]MCF0074108.1 hypothetical protein [Dyadobacter sp. CY261]
MRSILLITDNIRAKSAMLILLKDGFNAAFVQDMGFKKAASFLESNPEPDLIIYTSDLNSTETYSDFLNIKALAPKAKILLYAAFITTGPHLFDYLAAGANGLLSLESSTAEHRRALDTVMRGDSFIDDRLRSEMLLLSKQRYVDGTY